MTAQKLFLNDPLSRLIHPIHHRLWVAWWGGILLTLLCLLPAAAQSPLPDATLPEAAAAPVVAEAATANLLNQEAAAAVPPFVPGRVLVALRGDIASTAALDALQATAVAPLDVRGLVDDVEVTGYQLTVDAGAEWQAIEQLRLDPAVIFAEPDWLMYTAQAPNDAPADAAETAENAEASNVTAELERPFTVSDSLYPEQWYLQRINMSRAWSAALNESGQSLAEVKVTVIDTGVDFSHPDLRDRLLPGRNYDTPGTAPTDDNGHGTHIIGLIAAAINNGGMAGPALNVIIDPIKALNADGRGSVSLIASAMRDAADGNADIINLSLQVEVDSSTLRSAVNYAVSQGSLVVAAAGNCGAFDECPSSVRYPAAYPDVVGIAATTYYDNQAYYSAEGNGIDFAAPGGGSGTSILSTWPRNVRCTTSARDVNGGLYCQADGTSMAAGIASGVAALILSVNPDLNDEDVIDILEASAAPIAGAFDEVGAGRLDAALAVRMAMAPRLELSQTSFNVSSPVGGAHVNLPLELENPSLEPVSWVISSTASNAPWLGINGPTVGNVDYDSPAHTTLVITPTALNQGNYLGTLRLTATHPNGDSDSYTINVRTEIFSQTNAYQVYIPLVEGASETFTWAQPSFSARTAYTMSSGNSIRVNLPFTVTLAGRKYDNIRIYSDGFATLPASAQPANLPNLCLPNQLWPTFAIYGWWSDLDPSGGGDKVATFQPDRDHFVIEYNDVPSQAGVFPAYRVSFQMVIGRNGSVTLNYRDVPAESVAPRMTVGVTAGDGRFYQQLTCRTNRSTLGEPPSNRQTINITPGDLY